MKNSQQHKNSQKSLSIIVLGFVMLLIAANLFVSNILATTGEQLRALQNRHQNLKNQNTRLKQQVVQMSTLAMIEKRAKEMGMTEIHETLVVSPEAPMAMKKL